MRGRAARAIGGCLVLLAALPLPGSLARADAGREQADRLCGRALAAERDAREAERKSSERKRFLAGSAAASAAARPVSAPVGGVDAGKQAVRARLAQARSALAQIRQAGSAAAQDRGAVRGFDQYFARMESDIGRALAAAETCLDRPESCNPPVLSCPPPPPLPSAGGGSSAAFVRQIQQQYLQAANAARQACMNLNAGLAGEIERVKRESRAAAAQAVPTAGGTGTAFGDDDLYLRRADSLKREAAQFRLEADRLSGVKGYCGVRANRKVEVGRVRDPGIPPDGKVIDLKEAWERKWNDGGPLEDSGSTPLPVISGKSGGGDSAPGDELPDEFRVTWRDRAKNGYEKAASLYREADEQVKLTEFLTPPSPMEYIKDQAKDAAGEILVKAAGPFGKSVEAAITILGAVKESTEEIGEILEDAPRVIGSGSAADAQELADRAFRAPAKFLNSLFDKVTGEIDFPEYRYQYKKGWDEKP